MVAKKHKSKRQSLKNRYSIQKKIKEFKRKLNRDARRNPQQKPKKKDPGVPALWPFKKQELEEAELAREQAKQLLAEQKARRKARIEQKRKAKDKPAPLAVSAAEQAVLDAASKHNVAVKDLRDSIALADVLLYVLDARNPLAYRSADVEELIRTRPKAHGRVIFVLSKADLVPVDALRGWIKHLEAEYPTVALHSLPLYSDPNLKIPAQTEKQTGAGVDGVMELVRNYVLVAPTKPVNIAVIGHANTGKSSVINALRRMRVAAVAAAPFYTKTSQQIRLMEHVQIYDTPAFPLAADIPESDLLTHNLVGIHDVKHPVDAVCRQLAIIPPQALLLAYKTPKFADTREFLSLVAVARGKLTKAEPNLPVVARSLLQDWNDSAAIAYYAAPPAPTASSGSEKKQAKGKAAATGSATAAVAALNGGGADAPTHAYPAWGTDNHVHASTIRQNDLALKVLAKRDTFGRQYVQLATPSASSAAGQALAAHRRLPVDLSEHTATADDDAKRAGRKLTLHDGKPLDAAFIKRQLDAGNDQVLVQLMKSGALQLADVDAGDDAGDDDGEGDGDDDGEGEGEDADADAEDDAKAATATATAAAATGKKQPKKQAAKPVASAAPASAAKKKKAGPARPPAPVASNEDYDFETDFA